MTREQELAQDDRAECLAELTERMVRERTTLTALPPAEAGGVIEHLAEAARELHTIAHPVTAQRKGGDATMRGKT